MKSTIFPTLLAISAASLQAAVLVTPTGLTNTSGVSEFFTAINIVNDTGLSGAADIGNYTTITHGAAGGGNAWTTADPNGGGSDYFDAGSPGTLPVFTLSLGQSYPLTDLVFWGYHFGSANGNEGREFLLEFSTDGGGSFPTSTTVSNPLSTYAVANAATLSLSGTFDADTVRLSIPDNHFGGTAPGGDRVGLGEVKFVSSIPEPSTALLGSLAGLLLLRRRR